MKKTIIYTICTLSVFMCVSCKEEAKHTMSVENIKAETPRQDMSQIRADITAVEKQWAAAINGKDMNELMALYAEDAVSMPDGLPTLSGKSAIRKQQEADFAEPAKYASIAFETVDVYAQGDVVTEVGKTLHKDADGKETDAGKYVAIFEKRNGKYVCIREIYNKNTK